MDYPFTEEVSLVHNDLDLEKYLQSQKLPAHPDTSLHDRHGLLDILEEDLWAPELEQMAPRLWVMSTQSASNISPLHHQAIKGREILLTESARLHLVWSHSKIFVKPIPLYLLSSAHWRLLFSQTPTPSPLAPHHERLRRAALGFLRSYAHLIRHASDLRIARSEELGLVPHNTQWGQWCRFRAAILRIPDADVSGRYLYGELRLTRLNFYIKFFMWRFEYQRLDYQYADYFGRFYGPFLFVVGLFAVVLNAMQVYLTAGQGVLGASVFVAFSRWFSVSIIIILALFAVSLGLLWLWLFVDEWVFALRALKKRKRSQISADSAGKSHCEVLQDA